MSKRPGRSYCFDVRTDPITHRKSAIFSCHYCPAHTEVTISGHVHNPEMSVKRCREKGWEADMYTGRLVVCPDCQRKRKEDRKVQSPTKPTLVPRPPAQQPPARTPDTPDTRTKIRQLLDGFFDDKLGTYLSDGRGPYSDERIAKECNVPVDQVRQIRETAYGPIKMDPEMAKLLTDVENMKAKQLDLAVDIDHLQRKVNDALKARGLA